MVQQNNDHNGAAYSMVSFVPVDVDQALDEASQNVTFFITPELIADARKADQHRFRATS